MSIPPIVDTPVSAEQDNPGLPEPSTYSVGKDANCNGYHPPAPQSVGEQ